MRILITGANGFAGKYLVSFFSKLGHEVFGTYRGAVVPPFSSNSQITWVKVDLGKDLIDLPPVDVVIHTASVHEYSRKSPNCFEYVNSNVQSTVMLAEFAKRSSVNLFIYLSSISVHGKVTTPVLSEETPLFQPDIYGISKYMSERILEKYKQVFPTVVLRLPGLIGPKYEQSRPWIATVLQKALKHQTIYIFNKNSLFNNVTDVNDLGRVISVLIDQDLSEYEVLNLATSKPIKIIQVVKQIIYNCHSKALIVEKNTSKKSFHLNIERLRQKTGFEPKTTKFLVEKFVFQNIS